MASTAEQRARMLLRLNVSVLVFLGPYAVLAPAGAAAHLFGDARAGKIASLMDMSPPTGGSPLPAYQMLGALRFAGLRSQAGLHRQPHRRHSADRGLVPWPTLPLLLSTALHLVCVSAASAPRDTDQAPLRHLPDWPLAAQVPGGWQWERCQPWACATRSSSGAALCRAALCVVCCPVLWCAVICSAMLCRTSVPCALLQCAVLAVLPLASRLFAAGPSSAVLVTHLLSFLQLPR